MASDPSQSSVLTRGRAARLPSGAPFVLVPCDNRMIGGHPHHVLGRKYADAVHDVAACLPLLVPTSGLADIGAYLDLADGILLTGSPSNVDPVHFGQPVRDPDLPLDPERDQVTLPLVRIAQQRAMPLLAICRGLQEINVALGGTLHQAVHEVSGRRDHRGRGGDPEREYGPAHEIEAIPGGLVERVTGLRRFEVNSVHGQGIDRLAGELAVEAVATDGQIEAVRLAAHPGFALGVQWHPEWRPASNPVSMRLFAAFGEACRAYRSGRRDGAAGAPARAAADPRLPTRLA